jgi:hypothetical protein
MLSESELLFDVDYFPPIAASLEPPIDAWENAYNNTNIF